MTISNRQFTLLNAMNIPLWAYKKNAIEQAKENSQLVESSKNQISIESPNKQSMPSLADLTQNKLFIDILLSMKLTITDVSVEADHLNLGKFTWQLVEHEQVSFQQSILHTPSLKALAQSLSLKKQLWQIIKNHIIANDSNSSEKQS
jgi:DNA polymerase III psi subunit